MGSSRRRADNRAEGNSPHRQVHGADGEEREGVDFDHDGHEGHVEENFDEAWGERSSSGSRSWTTAGWVRRDGTSKVSRSNRLLK